MASGSREAQALVTTSSAKLETCNPIGEGGFGTVSKCIHCDWGPVAVKKMKAENINNIFSRRLKEEAEAQSKLQHPNITQMMGLIWEPGYYAVVMEFMKYGSLDEFCMECSPVPLEWKLKMIHDITLGMNYLHTRTPAMIHQDLKVQNCLVGDSFNVKISDFGLSEWLSYSRRYTSHTPKGGTVTHLPPERWKNINLKPDFKFDIYSFGILVWEIVTEQIPYDGCSDAQISHGVTRGDRPSTGPTFIPQETPAVIVNLMQESWHQDPSQRPTFSEIKRRLEILLNGLVSQIEMAKHTLFRQISESSLSSLSLTSTPPGAPNHGQYMDLHLQTTSPLGSPALAPMSPHVQFRSDDEVISVSMIPSTEPGSRPPDISYPGFQENIPGIPNTAATNPALPMQDNPQNMQFGNPTNRLAPIQRVQTDHVESNGGSQMNRTKFPVQRVQTVEQTQLLGTMNDLNISPTDNNARLGNGHGIPAANIPPGQYMNKPTVDLSTQSNSSVQNGYIHGASNNTNHSHVSTLSDQSLVGAVGIHTGPMTVDVDSSTGTVKIVNATGQSGVRGPKVVIHKTTTRMDGGASVQEQINITGDGRGVQIGNSCYMSVSEPSRPQSNAAPARATKKTITVAAKPVDHDAMDVVANNVGKSWRRLGKELGFSTGQLDIFQNDYRGLYDQIYNMLDKWVQETGPDASYKVLANKLVKIKKGDVAEKLQNLGQ